MMWNPWAGAVANIGDQKLGSNPEANDTSSPSWANVSKSTQPTINESTSSDDISESILIDHPPSTGEATPTPSLSRSPPPPPSNTAQTAPRTGADTQFSTAEISIDASRDNLASTSLKVVLPAGALGIRFKGYPPVIVEVFDTSPLKDTVSIGMKVLALHLPGEVRGLSNVNSVQLVTCLKDNLAKEGRVLLLEPLPDFNDDKLRPGDHIYIWKSYGMLGRAYQRHAVVYSVTKDCNGDDEDDVITVVSFYHAKPKNDTVGLLSEDDDEEDGDSAFILFKSVRVEPLERFLQTKKNTTPRKIHKVKYGSGKSGFARRILSRGGTTTLSKPDEQELIHHRLQYLLYHPEILPEYHDLSANGECAALWCRSGTWCTLQAASILEIMFAAQAGTAVVAGGIVSSLTVLVPVPGLLGAYGWFWYVPATVAYPFLVPLLVGYGMVSLVPLHILRKYRKQWKEMTFRLNFQFWSQATESIRDRFFGLSQSSDDDRMTNFFGVRGGEEEEDEQDRGTYMPLNSGGGAGGDTKDEGCGLEGDAQDEDKMLTMHRDSMAAAFESDESLSDPSQNRRTSWPFQNQLQRFLRNRRTSETGMIKGMIDKKKEDDPLVAFPSDVFE